MTDEDFEIVRGRGNIFADFGDPDAETKHMKAVLATKIIGVLDEQGLSAREAAKRANVAEADISRVRNASLSKFTLDWLVRVHHLLEPSVVVELTFGPRKSGSDTVAA
ncbi:helix-turn-helix domain-containing protein [Rhizobium sp. C4]|uniref:helix-turn-helix domain-containing protein n=1 Tax=Rhizobium sp. C4 TaxID=1349800 RepID=UPI001E38ED0D|nr:XRE family transcriptional regulator [Rhizobium sp. C4]MCD2173702.1 helix-turn-helix domain-containing protein [Rhizobium sp. C4]